MTSALFVIDPDGESQSSDSAQSPPSAAWSDWVGVVASVGCAIHCAAMPFVIAYLPALGLSFLADEAFHQWMALGCFVIALVAFVPGLRAHGRLAPVMIASVGLAMISVAAFGFAGECCPSCVTDASPVAFTEETGCTDAGCTACASDSLAASETETGADAGACCPSCDADASTVATSAETTCTDAGCTACASDSPAPLETDAGPYTVVPQPASPLAAWIAPWLTPLGGVVLVSAHLLNRRYGCLCGCCGSEDTEEATR